MLSIRVSLGWAWLLLLTVPSAVQAQFCFDRVESLLDPTFACADVAYVKETIVGESSEVESFIDSNLGLLEARYDGFDLIGGAGTRESPLQPFFAEATIEPVESEGRVAEVVMQHQGNGALAPVDSNDQLLRFDQISKVTVTPVRADGSFDPVELSLEADFRFTLTDPPDTETLGNVGVGAIVNLFEPDALEPLYAFGGTAQLDFSVSDEPVLFFGFASNATVQAVGDDRFDFVVQDDTTISVIPGRPLVLNMESFGLAFTDDFDEGDQGAWSADSQEGHRVTLRTDDPNVSLEITLEFVPQPVNYGVAGAWFNPETPGQGFLIDLIPETGFMFVPWFTFDTVSPQTGGSIAAAEQRWFTGQGQYSGNRAELTLYQNRNGVFDDPTETDLLAVGTMVIEFSTCTTATVTYDIPDLELSGVVPIIRLLPDTLCKRINSGEVVLDGSQPALSSTSKGAAQNVNYGLIGGWFDEATAGQGFMFDFQPEIDFMFVAWFTYDRVPADDDGDGAIPGAELRWFTAQGNYVDNRAELVISQTRSGLFDDPAAVVTFPVGTMTIDFTSCTSAEVSYELTNFSAAGDISITKLLGDEVCTLIENGDVVLD